MYKFTIVAALNVAFHFSSKSIQTVLQTIPSFMYTLFSLLFVSLIIHLVLDFGTLLKYTLHINLSTLFIHISKIEKAIFRLVHLICKAGLIIFYSYNKYELCFFFSNN